MSEAMTDNAAASAPPATAIGETPPPEKRADTTDNAPDPQFMDVLVRTQNECLAELGYYPTLLSEFQELQQTCTKLHADNQKLYSDNRSLALFIAQQNQRMALLQAPGDQQKRTIADLHESVRIVTNQRDEIQARLHAALHEVAVLRQELSKFVPEALISPRDRMPAHGSIPQYAQPMQNGHAPLHHAVMPAPMPANMQGNPTMPVPPNMPQYYRAPPPKAAAPGARPHNPQHRGSVPMLLPVDTSVAPIAQHRRPSAPAALAFAHNAPGRSPASASPSNTFAGLNLGSLPSTPVSSRPGTANGQMPSLLRHPSGSRPPSVTGSIHQTRQSTMDPSSSSLAGAIIDLTQDESHEDSARKRRKLEHTPSVEIPQAPASAPLPSPAALSGQNMHNGHISPMQTVVAQPFTVPQAPHLHSTSVVHQQPLHPHPSSNVDQPMPPAAQQSTRVTSVHAMQSHPPHAPQPHPPLSQIIAQSQPMPQSQPTPQSQPMPQLQSAPQAQSIPQVQSTPQAQSRSQAQSIMQAQSIPQAQSPPRHQPPPQSQLPPQHQQPLPSHPSPVQPSKPSSTPAQPTVVDTPMPDAVMTDAASEPVLTVEEESIEANYDEDEQDETKRWCRMCSFRFKKGHTTEEPKPFINASHEQLIEHCETVHPAGWEILKSKVAAQQREAAAQANASLPAA